MSRTHCERLCENCRLHFRICLCAEIVPVIPLARLFILQHPAEVGRPSGTVGLVASSVSGTAIFMKDDAVQEAELRRRIETSEGPVFLVFPDQGARSVVEARQKGAWSTTNPPTFVMIDASWRQARRMRRRREWLRSLPVVAVRDDRLSAYSMRRQVDPGHFSTVEAAAVLLAQSEDRFEKYAFMLDLLDKMVRRWFALRGRDREGRPVKREPPADGEPGP